MNLFTGDLFEQWRLLLATVCTIYAIVVTVRSTLQMMSVLVGSDRKAQVVRNYAIVLFLRFRIARFKEELFGIVVYGLMFLILLFWH